MGIFTGVGFIIIAAKSKKRHLIVASVVWGIYSIAALTYLAMYDSETAENPVKAYGSFVPGIIMLVCFFTGILHALLVNASWLQWRARNVKGDVSWSSHAKPSTAASYQSGAPLGNNFYGYGQQPQQPVPAPYYQAPPPRHTIDLNTASTEEIQYGLGLTREVAAEVVARRTAMRGFSSPEQLK